VHNASELFTGGEIFFRSRAQKYRVLMATGIELHRHSMSDPERGEARHTEIGAQWLLEQLSS
jgi:hypothetical protein